MVFLQIKRASFPTHSVVVLLVVILVSGLHIVVALTQWLPVGFIPEQPSIPAMRCNMVHNRSAFIPALCHATHTQRVRFQEALAGLLPFAPISTAGGRARFFRMERLVLGAVFRSIRHQLRAAGMTTGYSAPLRHSCSPPRINNKGVISNNAGAYPIMIRRRPDTKRRCVGIWT